MNPHIAQSNPEYSIGSLMLRHEWINNVGKFDGGFARVFGNLEDVFTSSRRSVWRSWCWWACQFIRTKENLVGAEMWRMVWTTSGKWVTSAMLDDCIICEPRQCVVFTKRNEGSWIRAIAEKGCPDFIQTIKFGAIRKFQDRILFKVLVIHFSGSINIAVGTLNIVPKVCKRLRSNGSGLEFISEARLRFYFATLSFSLALSLESKKREKYVYG